MEIKQSKYFTQCYGVCPELHNPHASKNTTAAVGSESHLYYQKGWKHIFLSGFFRGEYQPAQKELHKALCACDLEPVIHSDQIFISDHVTRQTQNAMMSFPVLYNST